MTSNALVLTDSATMLRRNLRRMRRYPSLTFFIAGMPVVSCCCSCTSSAARSARGSAARAGGRADYLAYVVPGDPR